jgi:hypothetical protein
LSVRKLPGKNCSQYLATALDLLTGGEELVEIGSA